MSNEINKITIDKGVELLPIGTVVRVGFVDQAVMIYGRKQKKVDHGEELYDYVACPYPQGHLSNKTNVFFQHEHIEEVYFKGFETAGEKILRERLKQAFNEK
ncbi:DUF4176 domain-containing protein [Halalkalibacterium halodurans]|uniref:BH2522 protein n=1 Tax=Halalkalibacterium halodurans (strain ATCC BAA-125 / DSM 18197 / FERM 7344 / JCM 9153 / C-125) TaxID=272558 RepID=Q9K9X2_HALH5|nr:DUF4176 domain-containing protein [Halalkalibacterium halodurans]MED4079670.1 DUF4176 domain-containing protein [Halalkalibacterium halodurans]MED4086388.1 DUF4176 domain-containing protein [Halalkalibacterium halodurans]MED4103267.1 DUF4176 domain-containing protein [Halalkalibacterium halodurans]MED4108036.1 DUF4176 domain-containing protein [Halalkalibacterium halodurans]MED4124511.1 DUF4176 domain-containing protein [Halalkalibacterium halodurans]